MAPSTTVIATTTMYAPQQNNGAGQPSTLQQQLDSIRSRLMTSIGVKPSTEWLQACLSHIQNKQQSSRRGGGGGVLIDAVLHQVLHSDLRDVVRGTTPSNSTSSSNHTASMTGDFRTAATLGGTTTPSSSTAIPAPVTQLLQAVQQSSQAAHKFHHTLLKNNNGNSFALLVQLEEVVDVSLPAERRLEAGTGRNSNDNHQHRQQQYRNGPPPTRCLKLCLTDGYNQSHTFVAMEQQAIPNLSPTSHAGLKFMLRAPLTVRHSLLLLNPGNCIVLGGAVSQLHEQQQKSLQAAIQEAGVGVDPTIRALIGTGAAANEDENEDEAHEASGDVQPHAQQPLQQFRTVTAQQQQQQQRSMPPPAIPARSTSRQSNTYNASSAASSSARSAWAGSSATTTAPPATTNPYGARNQHHQQQRHHTPPPTSQSRPSAINPYASSSSQVSTSTTASTATTATTNNPYLSSRNTAVASNTTTSIAGVATTASTIPSDPYQSSSSAATATAVTRAPRNLATTNCCAAMITASSNPALPTTPASTTAQSVAPPTVASISSPSPAVAIQNMDMPALYQLLTNLISNREMYESYYTQQNMAFRVQLKQFAEIEKTAFNVVKTKKNKKRDRNDNSGQQRKQKKKYEYLVTAVFEGVGGATNLSQKDVLACRIHPDFVEPHFPVSAAELRSMNRSERQKCEEITRVGGDKIKEAYFYKLNSWTATLHLSPDQVFAEEIVSNKSIADRLADTELPILCLQDPKTGV